MICELLFPSSILAVKLNRKTLIIVLEMEIYIYDISNMRLLHVIETPPNPEGESSIFVLHTHLTPWSNMRSLPICVQFVSRLPLPRSFPKLTSCIIIIIYTRRWIIRWQQFLSRKQITHNNICFFEWFNLSVWRRSSLLHPFINSCKRHSSTQNPHLLPRNRFQWHSPCYIFWKRNRDSSMEYTKCRETLSIQTRNKRSENLLHELQHCWYPSGRQLGSRYSPYI